MLLVGALAGTTAYVYSQKQAAQARKAAVAASAKVPQGPAAAAAPSDVSAASVSASGMQIGQPEPNRGVLYSSTADEAAARAFGRGHLYGDFDRDDRQDRRLSTTGEVPLAPEPNMAMFIRPRFKSSE